MIKFPVANGISTDHPIPGVPFVDDTHLPLSNGQEIERIGRHNGNDGWGRYDADQAHHSRWEAFTTEQDDLAYAWHVRHEPDIGRTIVLYLDDDATIMHNTPPQAGDPIAYRAGGYWWNGHTWHRPSYIRDASTGECIPKPVDDAVSITASDILGQYDNDPALGRVQDIANITPGVVPDKRWLHDLAYWASVRPSSAVPLDRCIVNIDAPELQRDALVSAASAARKAGISRAELRDARAQDGTDPQTTFPLPQWHTPHANAARWSVPVIEDWAWERKRQDIGSLAKTFRSGSSLPPGDSIMYAVRSAAEVDISRHDDPDTHLICLSPPLEQLLGWVVTEHPVFADVAVGDITRLARNAGMSDQNIKVMLESTLRGGVRPVGSRQESQCEELVRRVMPPSLLDA